MIYPINFIWQLLWFIVSDIFSLIFKFKLSYSDNLYYINYDYCRIIMTDYSGTIAYHGGTYYNNKYFALIGFKMQYEKDI